MKVIAVVVDSWRGLFLLPITPGKLEIPDEPPGTSSRAVIAITHGPLTIRSEIRPKLESGGDYCLCLFIIVQF
jgi:hypothetical protein